MERVSRKTYNPASSLLPRPCVLVASDANMSVCSIPMPPAPPITCSFSVSPCGTGANRYATINDALNYYNLSTFRTSLYYAGLSGSISLGQPAGITVFAPTNAAFASLLMKQNITMAVSERGAHACITMSVHSKQSYLLLPHSCHASVMSH